MENTLVTISDGQVRGTIGKLCDGTSYYSFKGIPYAEPPIGSNRFKAPIPKKPWQGILDANEHGPICPQLDVPTGIKQGNENCLFLNVYSKSLKFESKLPVMVFIHGGAFRYGSGNSSLYGPDYLIKQDVVLVTLNYRLEVLGFLCLDIPEISGNAGMRDQVLALKWVQQNILNFGGNPHNITLFGESAGSSSVSCHLFSPLSKGLFHRAILQSKVWLLDWEKDNRQVEKAFKVGKLLGCETDNKYKLLDFLQNVPVNELVGDPTFKTRTEIEEHRDFPITFGPTIENTFTGVEPFLSDRPINLLKKNNVHNVSIIIGYTSSEGILNFNMNSKKLQLFDQEPKYKIPKVLYENVSNDQMQVLADKIRQFYTKHKNYVNADCQDIIDLDSDINFIYNIYRFINLYSKLKNNIYLYKFDCITELNMIKKMLGLNNLSGACHGDELFYIFSSPLTQREVENSQKLQNLIAQITKLWTNFAKYGDPTPGTEVEVKWTPYDKKSEKYLKMKEKFVMIENEEKLRIQFWDTIFDDAERKYTKCICKII